MKIQVNSDKSISVDASLIRYVKGELTRVLKRFAGRLTRVEVHLSDVNSRKAGAADKRCLIEARPSGARPLVTSANATKLASAVGEASGKMRKLLTSFFGRRGKISAAVSAPVPTASKTKTTKAVDGKVTLEREGRGAGKKALAKSSAKLSPRGPKKKWIYQARRKPWPNR